MSQELLTNCFVSLAAWMVGLGRGKVRPSLAENKAEKVSNVPYLVVHIMPARSWGIIFLHSGFSWVRKACLNKIDPPVNKIDPPGQLSPSPGKSTDKAHSVKWAHNRPFMLLWLEDLINQIFFLVFFSAQKEKINIKCPSKMVRFLSLPPQPSWWTRCLRI